MKKKHLIMLGFLGLVMSLLPATAFASTSTTTQAKNYAPHLLFKKGLNQNHNQSGFTKTAVVNPATSPNMTYNGGPVMEGVMNVYLIFWEPTGSTSVSANYNSLITRYFNDAGNSTLYQMGQQYPDNLGKFSTGSVVAGSYVDNAAYTATPLLDTDIQNEVTHAQTFNGWASTSNNIFFVFTGKSQDICIDGTKAQCASNTFCAYHGAYGTNNTLYAAMPYAASFRCNPELSGASAPNHDDADQTINVASHEQMEAATDPLGNAWYEGTGNEIGDLCAWTFGPVNSQGADVSLNSHPYLLQQEWSNKINACALVTSPAHQYYKVVNRNSGLVMDVYGGGTNAGAQVIQWTYHNGSNQKWYLQPYGDTFQLVNEHSGLVMDVYGGGKTAGVNVIQWTNHHGLNQQWFLDPKGGYNVLQNVNSNLVADVYRGQTNAGAHVIQWSYNAGNNQQWYLVPVAA
jgi:hypothetical protein